MKVVTLDIDGVLNNYPTCWLHYIERLEKIKFNSIEDAKKYLGQKDYAQLKESYRASGYKKNLPVNPMAPDFTRLLKRRGYTIVVSTSRPFHLYPTLEKLTEEWLKSNHITFDYLERKSEQLLGKYPNILFHVDDELDHTFFFLEKNIRVFIVRRADINYEGYDKYKSLRFVDSLNDVLTLLD